LTGTEFVPDGKKVADAGRWLANITDDNRYYCCLPMVTDVYPMVAEESIVANPQKVVKIDMKMK
jgi:hypothetical protein